MVRYVQRPTCHKQVLMRAFVQLNEYTMLPNGQTRIQTLTNDPMI